MFSLFSQVSQLGICLLQGRYFLLLSPEFGMKLQRQTHDYYSYNTISAVCEHWHGDIRDNVIHGDLVKHVPLKHHAQNEFIQTHSVCIPERVKNHYLARAFS